MCIRHILFIGKAVGLICHLNPTVVHRLVSCFKYLEQNSNTRPITWSKYNNITNSNIKQSSIEIHFIHYCTWDTEGTTLIYRRANLLTHQKVENNDYAHYFFKGNCKLCLNNWKKNCIYNFETLKDLHYIKVLHGCVYEN